MLYVYSFFIDLKHRPDIELRTCLIEDCHGGEILPWWRTGTKSFPAYLDFFCCFTNKTTKNN